MLILKTGFVTSAAIAANATWNGSINNDWTTAGNWTPSSVPTSSSTAIINNGSTGPIITAAGAVATNVELGTTSGGTGTITISGGTLADTTGYVGYGVGSTGTATVHGAGSTWTNSTNFYVGQSGTGTLSIFSGGAVSDTTGYIGNAAGSTGAATVTGAGSQWTNNGNLYVGGSGTGTLLISSGGVVSNTSGIIASSSISTGTATVTGAGSTWSNSTTLYVGASGTGSLTISDGGSVNSTTGANIGRYVGSHGTVTVTGNGSIWTSNGGGTGGVVNIGNAGTGTVIIASGGVVSDTNTTFGTSVGGVGTATVTGMGSSLNSSDLYVGNYGTGTLTISNGAAVTTASGVGYNYTNPSGTLVVKTSSSTLYIADQPGSVGTLNIGSPAGSAPTAPGTLVANTVAFGQGTGTLVFNHTSTNYVFSPAITGNGLIEALAGNTLLAGDLSQFSGITYVAPGADLSTGSEQDTSLKSMAENTQAAMVESRVVGNELLGFSRPMIDQNYVFASSMFGSAEGLVGGQISHNGITFLGGLAYGHQDFTNMTEDDAPTVAAAVRYTFDDPFNDAGKDLHPFTELGGWVTPDDRFGFTRDYSTYNGMQSVTGSTRGMAWTDYARLGLRWDIDTNDQATAYSEVGQQRLRYGTYTETSGPFPATISGGVMRYEVARFGGSYTKNLQEIVYAPLSFTLSGAAARAFDTHADMVANIGSGTFAGDAANQTWGEFGATINAAIDQNTVASLGITGTSGAGSIGTSVHGIAGIGYRF